VDLRLIFVVLLIVTAILFVLRQGNLPVRMTDIWTMILDVLLVPAALLTVATFLMIIFRINPEQVILQAISAVSTRTVSFVTAVPEELSQELRAEFVQRHDTDGDDFEEWVVLYEYDLQNLSPVQISVYDNDRGVPPVIYPYNLVNPKGQYLGQIAGAINFSLQNVTQDNNGPSAENPDLPELVVRGSPGVLSIFRFNKANKETIPPNEQPQANPPRYESIGYFQGDRGANLGDASPDKPVTVQNQDRGNYERSQLVVRRLYTLNPELDYSTYYASICNYQNPDTCTLRDPVMKTVDFYASPPQDILASAFPEKIVLAFYAATCGQEDDTLCRWTELNWDHSQFLYPNSDASGGQPNYFGLNSLTNSRNLQVDRIDYFLPQGVEQAIDSPAESSTDIQEVQITFTVDDSPEPQTVRFEMRRTPQAQWKIFKRIQEDLSISDANVVD